MKSRLRCDVTSGRGEGRGQDIVRLTMLRIDDKAKKDEIIT